jgi:hypothetical protein
MEAMEVNEKVLASREYGDRWGRLTRWDQKGDLFWLRDAPMLVSAFATRSSQVGCRGSGGRVRSRCPAA